MSIKVVNVGLIDDETVMVQFSTQRHAAFTVGKLLALHSSQKTPEPIEPERLAN